MHTTEEIEKEALALHKDFASVLPGTESGFMARKDAWMAAARGSLARRDSMAPTQPTGGASPNDLPDHGPPDPGKTGGGG